MTITDSYSESSYLAGLACNLDVKSSYWQIKWQIYPPPVVASSGQDWQFHISTVKSSYCQIKWQIYSPLVASSARHHGILYYYGMYLAVIVESSRKGENLFSFLNI